MKLTAALLLSLVSLPVLASPPVVQYYRPTVHWDGVTPIHGVMTSTNPVTIAPLMTIQSGPRFDCIFFNTSTNIEYIDYGIAASATSLPVYPGQAAYCSNTNGVNQDFVSLWDTNIGDTYYILNEVLQQY